MVVLGPVGPNFGAGMTGGLAFLWDPEGRQLPALHGSSVRAVRLSEAAVERPELLTRFRSLLEGQRDAGSALATRLLGHEMTPEADTWLVEPWPAAEAVVAAPAARPRPVHVVPQPDRNPAVAGPVPTHVEPAVRVASG